MHCDRVIKRKPISAEYRISGEKNFYRFHRQDKALFGGFRIFPWDKICHSFMEKSKFWQLYSKILLWKRQKIYWVFSEFCKKLFTKPIFWKMRLAMCLVWNMFSAKKIVYNFNLKKNPTFHQFSRSQWDSRDGDGDSQCDRHDEFWSPPIKWGSLNIYRKYQKKIGAKSQC